MSEPIRYAFRLHEDDDAIYLGAKEQADGMWVKYEDYASLKEEAERYRLASIRVDVGELHAQFNRALFDVALAENARLKAEVERLEANTTKLCTHGDAEIARLKAEVERLTKAGDAMAKVIDADATAWFERVVRDWNAAKEGKQ